jgi:hypothetical protein
VAVSWRATRALERWAIKIVEVVQPHSVPAQINNAQKITKPLSSHDATPSQNKNRIVSLTLFGLVSANTGRRAPYRGARFDLVNCVPYQRRISRRKLR